MADNAMMEILMGFLFETAARVAAAPDKNESDDFNRGLAVAGDRIRDWYKKAAAEAREKQGMDPLDRIMGPTPGQFGL